MRIIQQHQQVTENLHFLLFKKGTLPVKENRNTLVFQHFRQFRTVRTDFRHQDHYVPETALFISHHFQNLIRGMICDRFQVSLILSRLQQVDHHRFKSLTVCSSGFQFIFRRVFQIRGFLPHDVPENRICRFKNFRSRTIVFLQENTLIRIRSLVCNPGQEEFRVSQTETIDTLFYVSHHKQGGLFPCQGLDQRVLHR